MAGLLKLNMKDSQFLGSLDAITDTMQTYKDNGGRFSVAEWKSLPQSERDRLTGQHGGPTPPSGATTTLHDAAGNVVGWRVNGQLQGLDGKPLKQ
jgi:hypothetical protein